MVKVGITSPKWGLVQDEQLIHGTRRFRMGRVPPPEFCAQSVPPGPSVMAG